MTDDKIKLLWSEFDGQVAPFARTIEARVLEELRKQEPVAYVSIIDDDKPRSDIIDRELPPLTPLYAAPIPPDNHDWKAEYLRQVDLHNQTLDELREAEMQLRNPAPTPPTPSQEEALDAKRWRYYADCPQTALMLGTELDPNSEQDWAAECSRLVDASLARPDTEGNGK